MDVIDYDGFVAAPLVREPFPFLVMPGFVLPDALAAACASFPGPDLPGVLPAPTPHPDDGFGRLLAALHTPRLTDAFSDKFGVSLDSDAMMVTLRARCRTQDGAIHTDSENKLVTALIYLNGDWSDTGGRLRLLRGPHDIDDMIAEVPPMAGTLVTFRRRENSWHGHKPFAGVRRAIMLNWMTDAAVARREIRRHTVSAGFKRLFADA